MHAEDDTEPRVDALDALDALDDPAGAPAAERTRKDIWRRRVLTAAIVVGIIEASLVTYGVLRR